MILRFYDTYSRNKKVFKPLNGKQVKMFVCGPTVYDSPHLGHLRTYLFYDFLVRFLKLNGFEVFYLQNITDIDDKIINRAKENKISPKKLALKYEKEYLKDIKQLKIKNVTKYARATSYIKQIQDQIRRLIDKGYAYQTSDGIYYNVKKFKDYGKLAKRTADKAQDATTRIDDSVSKINKGDFCLWKFKKDDEPFWKFEYGDGRPGWHIEDTAISEYYFGPQYDIHGGAIDLIFPHHEAEIAQMEALSGKKMVKYWIHTGFLLVNGEKMSKSLGNFLTVKDILKISSIQTLRFFIASYHYRSPINFNTNLLSQAEESLQRITNFYYQVLLAKNKNSKSVNFQEKIHLAKIGFFEENFLKALADDFNSPLAISQVFNLIKYFYRQDKKLLENFKINKKLLEFFAKFNEIFDVLEVKSLVIPKKVTILLDKREKLRKNKEYKKADELRKKITELGYEVLDTPEGAKIKKIK
jgi:cysteinyl-tRNA synthetase